MKRSRHKIDITEALLTCTKQYSDVSRHTERELGGKNSSFAEFRRKNCISTSTLPALVKSPTASTMASTDRTMERSKSESDVTASKQISWSIGCSAINMARPKNNPNSAFERIKAYAREQDAAKMAVAARRLKSQKTEEEPLYVDSAELQEGIVDDDDGDEEVDMEATQESDIDDMDDLTQSKELLIDTAAESSTSVADVPAEPLSGKDKLRKAICEAAGSQKEALKHFDTTNSGRISHSEFERALDRYDIRWQKITGCRFTNQAFLLFDRGKKGYLTHSELFPPEPPKERPRPNTPEFLAWWCRGTKTDIPMNPREAKWNPDNIDEGLELLHKDAKKRQEAHERKEWMRASIKRLKSRGKNAARCRELCALHLPRGTGPPDIQEVRTFSRLDLKNLKKAYQEQVNDCVTTINHAVYDMHQSSRELKVAHRNLMHVAGPHEETAKEKAAVVVKDFKGLFAGLKQDSGPLLERKSSKGSIRSSKTSIQ